MKKAKIKKLTSTAIIPTLGSNQAAGYDVYADTEKETVIKPHETVMVPLGISITPPKGYFIMFTARSGLASKRGLAPANKVGIGDYDYTGQYFVPLHNHTNEIQKIDAHERVAQMIFMPYTHIKWVEVDELEKTERGAGGFGSTGKK